MTANSTKPSTPSPSAAPDTVPKPGPTSANAPAKAKPPAKPAAVSNGTSPDSSTDSSNTRRHQAKHPPPNHSPTPPEPDLEIIEASGPAINQIHALVVTAPDQVKHHLSGLSPKARVKVCAGFRPGTTNTTIRYAKQALRSLARRYQILTAEIRELDTEINRLCAQANPALLATPGIGPDIAAALLIAAGDNPERMTSEASFAALCGVSPVQASSGRIVRHRLNRGGNRQANQALWRIATIRTARDQRTIAYVKKRRAEGKTRREIIRCLKRHIAREIYHLLTNPPPTPSGSHLRCLRQNNQTTLAQAATALHSHTTHISRLERGLYHNHHLATRYHQWLTTLTPHQNRI